MTSSSYFISVPKQNNCYFAWQQSIRGAYVQAYHLGNGRIFHQF